jgi:hypothetical protein
MSRREKLIFYLCATIEIVLCISLTAVLMMHPEYGILGDLVGTAFIVVGANTVGLIVEFNKTLKRNKYSYGLI